MGRILIYCTKLLSNGGIESHILQFCQRMSEEGVAIDILVPEFAFREKETELLKSYCKRMIVFRRSDKRLRKLWLLVQLLRLSKTRYDALYTNGQGESFLWVGKLINYKKWVHHHHQSGDKEDQATWGNAYKTVLLTSHSLIACSFHNARMMESVLQRKVDVITCFSRKVSVKDFSHTPGKAIRLGYFGRLIPEKGIDLLCTLSEDQDLRNVEFHIWGEGEAYPSSYFRQYPAIRYHGPFSGYEGLVDAISGIDAFLLLSHHPEGLPICLLEVMSAGVPWLASDRGGIRDIACDPMSTRVIQGALDYAKVKAAVLSLLNDIRDGKVSNQEQIKLYDNRFSADALSLQWKKMLFAL